MSGRDGRSSPGIPGEIRRIEPGIITTGSLQAVKRRSATERWPRGLKATPLLRGEARRDERARREVEPRESWGDQEDRAKNHYDRESCTRLNDAALRRGGREAEGTPLLREYRVKNSIEGSNPSLSANSRKFTRHVNFRESDEGDLDLNPRFARFAGSESERRAAAARRAKGRDSPEQSLPL